MHYIQEREYSWGSAGYKAAISLIKEDVAKSMDLKEKEDWMDITRCKFCTLNDKLWLGFHAT